MISFYSSQVLVLPVYLMMNSHPGRIHMHQDYCLSVWWMAVSGAFWISSFFFCKSVSTWLKYSQWVAKAWKIKQPFRWAEHQTWLLDCTQYPGFFFFFLSWNWKHLGGRCITYLNATRHISVCLNIPIYSKTVSALLKWIMDGKSRHWVISYDTIMFCLCQHVSLWDCYILALESWAWWTSDTGTFLPPTRQMMKLRWRIRFN